MTKWQVTYTHQKHKKKPKYQDGTLRDNGSGELMLLSSSGEVLDTLRTAAPVEADQDLDFPGFRCYVDVCLEHSAGTAEPVAARPHHAGGTSSAMTRPRIKRVSGLAPANGAGSGATPSNAFTRPAYRPPLKERPPQLDDGVGRPTTQALPPGDVVFSTGGAMPLATGDEAGSAGDIIARALQSSQRALAQSQALQPRRLGVGLGARPRRTTGLARPAIPAAGPSNTAPAPHATAQPTPGSLSSTRTPVPTTLPTPAPAPAPAPASDGPSTQAPVDRRAWRQAYRQRLQEQQLHQQHQQQPSTVTAVTPSLTPAVVPSTALPSTSPSFVPPPTADPGAQTDLLSLHFMTAAEVNGTPEQRQVVIPPCFSSVLEYRRTLTNALIEQLNIQLRDVAIEYHRGLSFLDLQDYAPGCRSGDPNASNPSCKHGRTVLRAVKKEGANKGRMFYSCPKSRADGCGFFLWVDEEGKHGNARRGGPKKTTIRSGSQLEVAMRGYGVRLHAECSLGPSRFSRPDQGARRAGALYVTLGRKDHHKTYSRDDLWVVSRSLAFGPAETFVAISSYFGPNKDNELEIIPHSGYRHREWDPSATVYAIHAFNAGTESLCMKNLEHFVDPRQLPILPALLGPRPTFNPRTIRAPQLLLTRQRLETLASDFCNRYRLNEDQQAVLWQMARDLPTMDDSEANQAPPTVRLVHGVYGAGKSFLVAVLIMFVSAVFDEGGRAATKSRDAFWRMLVSSTTNVAVDRILEALVKLGYEDFVRVGSAKKISAPVRPYSTHGSASGDKQELRELKKLYAQEVDDGVKHTLRRSIESLKEGANRERLADARLVGVTCAATAFPCLDHLSFPIIILDEACQMTEPNALLPAAKFRCRLLLLVGDPKQLSPTVTGAESAGTKGLEQTLFDRLMSMGTEPIMLRTQYRCHPAISAVTNRLFYQSRLRDGVAAVDRPTLAPPLPPLSFCDVARGEERRHADVSYINEAEAGFVVQLVSFLLDHHVEPEEVGVICLYRAQAEIIEERLKRKAQAKQVQVSTVDAFQGGEKQVVIVSCVRTQQVGFIDSEQRVNVALTRAKNHLILVGNRRLLRTNKLWSRVIAFFAFAKAIHEPEPFMALLQGGIEDEARAEAEAEAQVMADGEDADWEALREAEAAEEATTSSIKNHKAPASPLPHGPIGPASAKVQESPKAERASDTDGDSPIAPRSRRNKAVLESDEEDAAEQSRPAVAANQPKLPAHEATPPDAAPGVPTMEVATSAEATPAPKRAKHDVPPHMAPSALKLEVDMAMEALLQDDFDSESELDALL